MTDARHSGSVEIDERAAVEGEARAGLGERRLERSGRNPGRRFLDGLERERAVAGVRERPGLARPVHRSALIPAHSHGGLPADLDGLHVEPCVVCGHERQP